jgi:hypothetical protein
MELFSEFVLATAMLYMMAMVILVGMSIYSRNRKVESDKE